MMKTFEELINEVGSETVYSGTSVDQATQGALLEWNFDRPLSVQGDDTKWMRYFRRNLNMFYPIYLDYLRVESVRSNMDPFITEFMERIHEDSGESTTTGTGLKTGASSHNDGETTLTNNTSVRTPDLTTNGTTGNTRTDNTQSSTTGTDTGTVTTDTDINTDDDSISRALSIAYPEANMNSIPTDLSGFPTNIDYAQGEADTIGHNDHVEDNTLTETRNLANSNTTTNTGTVTDAGNNSVRETGTDTNDFEGSVTKNGNGTSNSSETTSSSTGVVDNRTVNETEQGRHESPADLLPRAISAITGSNSIKWLVGKMQVCFDNYCLF